MKTLSIDIETYSDQNLAKTGVYRYVESPIFEILLFSYSVDGGPVQLVDLACGEIIPADIIATLEDDAVTKWAFNANFERVCLSRYLGYPTGKYLDPGSWKCSMVWAATMGLPLSLEGVGAVLGLEKQKLTEGKDLMSPYGIATRLTADGIKSPGGKEKWNAGAVRSILTNEKYKGDALLQKSYTVDFLTKKKKINEGEIPQYYVEGNHEAIISPEVFELVQQELELRKQSRGRHSGVHLFSGKICCGQCGEWYGSKTWHSNSKYRRVVWQCNHKFYGDQKCTTPHLTDDDIKGLFVSAVNQLITQKDAIITALTASLDTAFDLTALKAEQAELESEMTVVSDLIQKCIYENAHVALDQVEYQKRYDGLTARFDIAKARHEALDETIRSKQSRRATIEAFLATLAEANLVDTFDTALWCGLVDFVTVHSTDDVRITFRNGMEIKA